MKILFYTILIFTGGAMLVSCESEYASMVKTERSSGVIHEDLILGMKMGQTQKDFYDACWLLNKEGIVHQGPGNKYALWTTNLDSTDEKSQKVDLLFYGVFDSLKVMNGMEMKIRFTGWSPWSKGHQSSELIKDLKVYFMKMFGGNEFISVDAGKERMIQVKVDGNRQIKIYPLDEKDVKVYIEDLRKLDGYGFSD